MSKKSKAATKVSGVYTINAAPIAGDGFRRVSAFGKSVFLGDPDNAAEKAAADKKKITLQKTVTGFLIGAKVIEKAGKGRKGKAAEMQRSVVLHLQTADGAVPGAEVLSVFSGGQLSWLLLTDYDNPKTVAVKPDYKNRLIRVAYLGLKEIVGQPQPVKDYDVEAHTTDVCANILPVS